MALGSYNSKTKKGSGIKEIFQANPYIEYANGTEQQYLDYCSKDFDYCKNLLHNPNPKKEYNDNDDNAYLEAVSDILNRKDINKTIVKFVPKCKKWAYTPQGLRKIAKAMKIKFIIKYERELIDKNGKGNIIFIFEKGNKKEFNERIFDIEFNKGTTLKKVEKVTVDLGIEGEIYQDVKTRLFY
ncbi:hypothetical protein F8M41_005696 [Gigaspora margarita]|uniref:Uncharacterized protein n=1 Tax=Gigaspora margarita TaxID=4874 RepID=A0A8H4A5X6_GIGMA|nr:hypothetical protein F8M41_005696 [Gigaspora margarita]